MSAARDNTKALLTKVLTSKEAGFFERALCKVPGSFRYIGYPILDGIFKGIGSLVAIFLLFSPLLSALNTQTLDLSLLFRNGWFALLALLILFFIMQLSSAFFCSCFWGRVSERLRGSRSRAVHIGVEKFSDVFALKLILLCIHVVFGAAFIALCFTSLGLSVLGVPSIFPMLIFIVFYFLFLMLLHIAEKTALSRIFMRDDSVGEALLSAFHLALYKPWRSLAIILFLGILSLFLQTSEFFSQLFRWTFGVSLGPTLDFISSLFILFFSLFVVVFRPLLWLSSAKARSYAFNEPRILTMSSRRVRTLDTKIEKKLEGIIIAPQQLPYDFSPDEANLLRISDLLQEQD